MRKKFSAWTSYGSYSVLAEIMQATYKVQVSHAVPIIYTDCKQILQPTWKTWFQRKKFEMIPKVFVCLEEI